MNYPLIDIRQILINAGITSTIVIDGFEVGAEAETKNQVNIQSEPSSTRAMQHWRQIQFSIYNKHQDKETCIAISRQIRGVLINYFGSLAGTDTVRFKIIKCVSEPYFWGESDDGANIYMSKYEAVINDTDISSIYM
jgi:hypothetical protein